MVDNVFNKIIRIQNFILKKAEVRGTGFEEIGKMKQTRKLHLVVPGSTSFISMTQYTFMMKINSSN